MNTKFLRTLRGKLVVVVALGVLVGALALSFTSAAATDAAPCDQGGGSVGCVDISLLPATLTADIYVGDTLVATGLSAGRVNVRPYSYTKITAKNVRDASPEFGDVYAYREASTYVYVYPGQIVSREFGPTRAYLKGFLTVTCGITGVQPGDSVACRPAVNGVDQADLVAGQTATYNLLPGVYNVHIGLVGLNAAMWSPAGVDNSVTILAGATQTLAPAFSKQNLVALSLDQPGVYGDFYANGALVATQVPTTQVWLPANQTSTLEVKNITDPAALDYKWADAKTTLTLTSGEVVNLPFILKKEWTIGWVDIGCQLEDQRPEDDVLCTVIYDGQPKIIMKSTDRAKFTAAPGPHTVTVVLEGLNANRWQFAKVTPAPIVAGEVFTITVQFKLQPPSAARTTVLTGVGPNLREVYLRGQTLGNSPYAFSKIGDCETFSPLFLQPIATGKYALGEYSYLQPTISQFGPSYSHVGQAAINGLQLHSILDPFWADRNVCAADESPLTCEYRNHKPSIALILVRTANYGNGPDSEFDLDLRELVQASLDRGVIPVLSTLAYQGGPHPNPAEMNATIRQVATDTQVPLWDFWLTTESLPNRGVDETFHLTVPANPDFTMYFTPENMSYGMTRRNLEALQVLHEVLHKVILMQ